MAYSDNIYRPRLIVILFKLQIKLVLLSKMLAEYFEVNRRTIYQDLSSLEQAGIPLFKIDGKGYGLMDGYRLP